MDTEDRKMQWELSVQIWHDSAWGHELIATVYAPGRKAANGGDWRWKGLGLPAELVTDIATRLEALLVEHLVTRYGITGTLPTKWAGEPDPF